MASRQLGKLRQWAGEIISSREKTITYSDDFQDLERMIDQRKTGANSLAIATDTYCRNLSEKKDSPVPRPPSSSTDNLPTQTSIDTNESDKKFLPLDSLGIAMIVHGEQIGEESDFGRALVQLGQAQCKAATLQEAFSITLRETFLETLSSFDEDIQDYIVQRRKLDGRRLAYDAALSKVDKLGKSGNKEKEKLEAAEEELDRAKFRFEETSEDVRAHMTLIQDREANLMTALTHFLNLSVNHVQQHLQILQEAKSQWPTVTTTAPLHQTTSPHQHNKSHSASISSLPFHSTKEDERKRSMPNASSSPRFKRIAATFKMKNNSNTANLGQEQSSESPRPSSESSDEREEEEVGGGGGAEGRRSRRPSSSSFRKRSKSDASNKSAGTVSGGGGGGSGGLMPTKFSVSGVAEWASSAVGGVISSTKDRETFKSLDDNGPIRGKASGFEGRDEEEDDDDEEYEDGGRRSRKRTSSRSSGSGGGNGGGLRSSLSRRLSSKRSDAPGIVSGEGAVGGEKLTKKNRKNSLLNAMRKEAEPKEPKKVEEKVKAMPVVKALYDFNGSSTDELAFKCGDEIRVINEVLDDWWMGEIVMSGGGGREGNRGLFPASFVDHQDVESSDGEEKEEDRNFGRRHNGYSFDDDDDEDIYRHRQPLSAAPSMADGRMAMFPRDTTRIGGGGTGWGDSDTLSVSSSIDESQGLMKREEEEEKARWVVEEKTYSSSTRTTPTIQTKKPPPPPPPPRRPATHLGVAPPALPARNVGHLAPAPLTTRSQSAGASPVGYSTSPFDSAADLMAG